MSSYIKASILSGVLLFSSLPAIAAEGAGGSANPIKCDSSAGLSPEYLQNICKPLQEEFDRLSNGEAQPPKPIVMKEPLDIQQYRISGINAIIQFKNNSQVNSSQDKPNNPLDDIKLWNLQ